MQMVRLSSSQFSLQIKWDILNPNLGQKESVGPGEREQTAGQHSPHNGIKT